MVAFGLSSSPRSSAPSTPCFCDQERVELGLHGPALTILGGLDDEHHHECDKGCDRSDHHVVAGVEQAATDEEQPDRPQRDQCHRSADRRERSEEGRHVGHSVTRLVMDTSPVGGQGLLVEFMLTGTGASAVPWPTASSRGRMPGPELRWRDRRSTDQATPLYAPVASHRSAARRCHNRRRQFARSLPLEGLRSRAGC